MPWNFKSILRREKKAAAKPAAIRPEDSVKNPAALLNPVRMTVNLARDAVRKSTMLQADAYVPHGVQPLLAAAELRRVYGGQMLPDMIEIPSFRHRAVPVAWAPEVLTLLDSAFAELLRDAKAIITVGHTLGDQLHQYCSDVVVIENFRDWHAVPRSNRLREQLNLDDKQKIAVSVGTVASGCESVIEGLSRLPSNVHLVFVGTFAPASYEQCLREAVAALGLEPRVHFLQPIPYGDLSAFTASADFGVIIRDPAILNNYVSLPNRVFDYVASGLPLCAPQIPDIAKIINTYRIGTVVTDLSPAGWSAAFSEMSDRSAEMRGSAEIANDALTWAEKRQDIEALFKDFRTVCFIGVNDLTRNNRTMRFAKTLAELGKSVKIACRAPANIDRAARLGAMVIPLSID
ncbi:glycosyltransferase [Dongia sp.]|uniref:glycosyltransferase n=1 Tax=Dongia sp. TaxID=1977262 RepID=UPI003752D7B9